MHLVPVMRTLEIVKDDSALAGEREAYWIRHFRYLGIALTNDVVYYASEKLAKQNVGLTIDEEKVFISYPEVLHQWVEKGRKTATIDEIMEVTGQSKRRLNKTHFQRSPRNQKLVLVSSVIEWLKSAPLPIRRPGPNTDPIPVQNGHSEVQPLGDLIELNV